MRVTFRAYVVMGIPVQRKSVETYETKYNEDTGVPYQKLVQRTHWETSNGTRLNFDPHTLVDRRTSQLQFFSSDWEQKGVVGCKLGEVSDNRIDEGICIPDTQTQLELQRNVREQLVEHGCSAEPWLVLFMTCE